MKNPLIVSLLALAISAVGLGIMLTKTSSSAPRDDESDVKGVVRPQADVLGHLEALSEENRELRERLARVELRDPAVQRAPVTEGFVALEDFDAFRDEVREALEGRDAPGEAALASPDFKAKVADTLSEIQLAEAVAKARARQEKQLAALDATVMPKLESWLELNAYQSGEMRSALVAKYERDADLTRRWESGEATEVLGEVKRTNHETHQAELAEFLTPQQHETYRRRGSGK